MDCEEEVLLSQITTGKFGSILECPANSRVAGITRVLSQLLYGQEEVGGMLMSLTGGKQFVHSFIHSTYSLFFGHF